MVRASMSQKTSAFRYGFLASHISRLISVYKTKGASVELNEDDIAVLEAGEKFMGHIMDGQKLIFGDKEGFSPSSEGLQAVDYAITTLEMLQSLGQISKPETRHEMETIFKQIKEVLSSILVKKALPTSQIDLAHNFFSAVADMLLEEIQGFSHSTNTVS